MLSNPLRVSVVVCTYNRARRYLPLVLDSLRAEVAGRDDVEVVVINNASPDDTAAVVAEGYPEMRLVLEPELGCSVARNRGWREARAPLIAYIDDDALAEPGWLDAILRAADEGGDDVAGVGGPVDLLWEQPRPEWFCKQANITLGGLDHGDVARDVNNLRGGNVAYRRAALEAIGGFDTGLGRIGPKLVHGEENWVNQQLVARGYRLRYDPAIRVLHHVGADRLERRYVVRWSWGAGVTAARVRMRREPAGPLRRAVWAARELARLPALAAAAARSRTPSARFDAVYTSAWRAGLAAEYLAAGLRSAPAAG